MFNVGAHLVLLEGTGEVISVNNLEMTYLVKYLDGRYKNQHQLIDQHYISKSFPFVPVNYKEKPKMFSNFKNYVLKYKDWFFTIGMLLLVDHFVFNGAFKKKVQERVSKVLEKV
jgi:hypothetical protein